MLEISVIMATCGRAAHLERCLSKLTEQQVPPDSFEVVITIDGSDAATVDVLKAFLPRLQLSWQETGCRRGPAVARNRSLRAARAPLIAVTDDDCEPDPGWLEAFRSAFRSSPELGVAIGRTITCDDRLTPFSHYVRNQHGEGHQTCNIAFRREVLDQLGGFDERFPVAYLEDTDLFCRAKEQTHVEFVADALVFHPPRELGTFDLARTARKYESDFIFFRKHPALYRSRHRGMGALASVLWLVGVKHVIKQVLAESRWLRRDPVVFCRYTAAMFLFAVTVWSSAPRFWWKHRRGPVSPACEL